jgi:site-specific recombinase XerD
VAGYQRMVVRAGATAGFPFLTHSHMLRHPCGHKSANDGQDTRAIQDYLGVRYTALALDRFKKISGKTEAKEDRDCAASA